MNKAPTPPASHERRFKPLHFAIAGGAALALAAAAWVHNETSDSSEKWLNQPEPVASAPVIITPSESPTPAPTTASPSRTAEATSPSASPTSARTPASPTDTHAHLRKLIANYHNDCNATWTDAGGKLNLEIDLARNNASYDARENITNGSEVTWSKTEIRTGSLVGGKFKESYPVQVIDRGGGNNGQDPKEAIVDVSPRNERWFGIWAVNRATSERSDGSEITTVSAVLCGANAEDTVVHYQDGSWRPGPLPEGVEPLIAYDSIQG